MGLPACHTPDFALSLCCSVAYIPRRLHVRSVAGGLCSVDTVSTSVRLLADLKLLSEPTCAIAIDFNASESLAQSGTGCVDVAISGCPDSTPVMLVYWFEFDFSPVSSDSFSTSHIGANSQLCWRQNVWYPAAETVHSLTIGELVSLQWAYAGDRLSWHVLRRKPCD